jgi:TRAP-type mannitol/chloroaromatic compound transport system substrate-binding protein
VYVQKIRDEGKVDIRPFPAEVMQTMKSLSEEAVGELASQDALSRRIFESFEKTRKSVGSWARISEAVYYNF